MNFYTSNLRLCKFYSIMSEVNVKLGLYSIWNKIDVASAKRAVELQGVKPRLVAVSKTKPIDLIIEAYEAGQRHFGENYVQELVDKATDRIIQEKCNEIKWHFIGHLQTNKINKIINIPNLFMIETVDTKKLATNLNAKWIKKDERLNVMVQVNTSGEGEKNGVEPKDVTDLVKYIINECPNLKLDGLMTIGQFGYNSEQGANPDFISLKKCKEEVCRNLSLEINKMNLSMGMSDDFEHAIELGSTNVRVGSSIFGVRNKKN